MNRQKISFRSIPGLVVVAMLAASLAAHAATGLDTTFGPDGRVVFNGGADVAGTSSTARAVAVDPATGKIFVVGEGRIATVNNMGISFARFNADGSPDATFGVGGRRVVNLSSGGLYDARGNGVAFLADGSVIGVGSITDGNAVVVKMTAAGSLDTTFGGGTVFASTFGATGASLNAVALLADGSILAAGGTSNGNFVVAKLTAAGLPDNTFGSGGFVTTDFNGGSDVAASLVVQTDGKIVVGGRSSNDCAVARYNANGSLDTSFGTGGKVVTTVVAGNPDEFRKLLLQTDGKIVGLGNALPNGFERHLLVRYTTSGALDSTFGTGGIAGGYFGNNQEFVYGGALLANGKIFVAGMAAGVIGTRASATRYNADGSVDKTYLCGGFGLTYAFANTASYNYAAAVQPDGKVVTAGQGTSATITTNSFQLNRYLNAAGPTQCPANDFERDGKSDLAVFRPSDRSWYIGRSSNSAAFSATPFGLATDKLVPADYDGDARADIAVWRESEGNFYILNSTTNAVRVENFGLAGDKPTVGDWDGDGKADLSTFRAGAQSSFYFRGSLNNPGGAVTFVPWGAAGDKAAAADYDGDGRLDAAVYRASNQTWYVRNSSNGALSTSTFGTSTDRLVPADYDGDGKTDVAVFRPSNGVWYILQSSNAQVRYQTFGLSGDLPAPADYDGDGLADVTVFRGGVWYILQSSNGQVAYPQFGAAGDVPVQNDLLP